MQGWEARALPSEERCERWRAAGGEVLVNWKSGGVSLQGPRLGVFVRPAPHEYMGVRPWKDGNPVTWSDFYATTHPPIPEGWEKVGEWYEPLFAKGRAAGIVDHVGHDFLCSGDGCAVAVRRIAHPIDWPDVPEGVNLPHCGYIPVERDGKRVGIVFPHGALWRSLTDGTPSQFDDHPSLPAAIVALTGRRA